MDELKKKMEAILFSVGKFISLEEIARLCRKDVEKVREALLELKVDYENNDSSLVVLNEENMWKLATREEYSSIVRKIVAETELTKTQLETLAVIAFKYPIKQSDLIKIRTNKAYDHLMELERGGFITRKKYGRSKLIRLTDKFFEYFDLPKEKLKDRFKGFEQLADTIEKKEGEIETAKEEQRKSAEEAKKEAEKERKVRDGEIEIDLIDEKGGKEKLEVYDEPREGSKAEEVKEKLGELEVVDEEPEKEETEENNENLGTEKEDESIATEQVEEETKDIEKGEEKKQSEEKEEGTDLLEAEQEESGEKIESEAENIEEEIEKEKEGEGNLETDEKTEEESKKKDEVEVDLLEAEQKKAESDKKE